VVIKFLVGFSTADGQLVEKTFLSLDGDCDVVADGGQLDVLLLLGGGLVVAGVEDQLDEAGNGAEAVGDLNYIVNTTCMITINKDSTWELHA
jgi:hypothetical protein